MQMGPKRFPRLRWWLKVYYVGHGAPAATPWLIRRAAHGAWIMHALRLFTAGVTLFRPTCIAPRSTRRGRANCFSRVQKPPGRRYLFYCIMRTNCSDDRVRPPPTVVRSFALVTASYWVSSPSLFATQASLYPSPPHYLLLSVDVIRWGIGLGIMDEANSNYSQIWLSLKLTSYKMIINQVFFSLVCIIVVFCTFNKDQQTLSK